MNSVIINFYKFRNTRQANITENNIEDILNSIFVTSSLFARQPSSNFCYNFSKTAFRGALWQSYARKKSTPSTSNFACFDTRGKIFIANSRRTTEKRKGK